MCNYCQTSSISSNSCGYTPRWRVQRICYDCQGDIHVIVSNGCVCRRLTCGVGQGNLWTGEVNVSQTNTCGCFYGGANNSATINGNGCSCGCANNSATTNGGCFGRCANREAAAYATATQNTDSYYARLYGSNFGTNGRSCCCGGYTAL